MVEGGFFSYVVAPVLGRSARSVLCGDPIIRLLDGEVVSRATHSFALRLDDAR